MDPMRVPLAASMAAGRDDTFAAVLDQAVAAAPGRVDPRQPSGERVDARTAEVGEAAPPPPAEPAGPELADDADAATAAGAADPFAGGEPAGPALAPPEPQHPDEAASSDEAGNRAGPARAAVRPEPLLTIVPGAAASPSTAPITGAATGTVAAVGAARAADPTGRGGDATLPRSAGPLRAPQVAASYRTASAASAELLEHARDSVFKQILMKLTGDGGEMRLRLEPPDLGELDLTLVVQNGNRLDLTIAAERPDLAHLLQRHLDELTASLQQAGLEIGSATVQTRSELARERQQRQQQQGEHAGDGGADDPTTTNGPRRGGYVSATGLDFWA